jgi:hypothetical protein
LSVRPSTSELFAFKRLSNLLQRVLNSLILQSEFLPYLSKEFFTLSFKGGKSAISTLLAFQYPSKGFFLLSLKGIFHLILKRGKKCNFEIFSNTG